MSVRVKDQGARRLLRELKKKQPVVEVGVLGDKASETHEGGPTNADIGEWAEFGLGQPKRSWLREWVDGAEDRIRRTLSTEIKRAGVRGLGAHVPLGRVGAWSVGQIQKRIAAGIAPPNAQLTIDKKGSETPLIDTGLFRSSIAHRVKDTK